MVISLLVTFQHTYAENLNKISTSSTASKAEPIKQTLAVLPPPSPFFNSRTNTIHRGIPPEEQILLTNMIIFEEFCKELAALVHAKATQRILIS